MTADWLCSSLLATQELAVREEYTSEQETRRKHLARELADAQRRSAELEEVEAEVCRLRQALG